MARKYSGDESYRQYAIPYNFIDESKMFGGMFKTRNFVEGVILSAFFICPILLMPVSSLTVKACLLIFFGLPPIVFGIVGINNDALSTFFLYYIKYKKNKRKVYFNSRVKQHAEVDIEEGLKAELPRDKVMKLFGPIINKRGTDTAEEGAFVFDDDIDNAVKRRKEKNRRIDYSIDSIIYEGYVVEDQENEYPEELNILASRIMENGEYEDDIYEENIPEEKEYILEYDDIEIIESLDKISKEMAEEIEKGNEVECADDIDVPQEAPDEYLDLMEDIEILGIISPEQNQKSEQAVEECHHLENVADEKKNEPYSEEIGINEPSTINDEKKPAEDNFTTAMEDSIIDILNLGLRKSSTIEEEPKKEMTEDEPTSEDCTPDSVTISTAHIEEKEDTKAEDSEGEDPEVSEEGTHKRKRRRKRRRNKKPDHEGGEAVEQS